jgi:lipopolysaccharide assembly outer membrane protein LptD (OstA)
LHRQGDKMSEPKIKSQLNLAKNAIEIIAKDNSKNASIDLDSSKEEINQNSKSINITGTDKVDINAKDITLKADQTITLDAGKQITLKVGGVKIDITSSSIAIEAMASKINMSSSKTDITAPTVSVNGNASVKVQTINLDLKAAKTTL